MNTMEWFGGSVVEAIQHAKMKEAVFVVHIYGDDVDSRKMTETWNDESVRQLVTSNNCVAIRLLADSQSGRQFSQIYPVICVPSVFFISGSNGIPLEICGGSLSPAELIEKCRHAIQLHNSQGSANNLSAPQTTSVERTESSDRSTLVDVSVTNEASSHVSTDTARDAVRSADDDTVASVDTALPPCSSDGAEDRISLEEKRERAAALLAERRNKKQTEEKEKEKAEEVERRKLGQDINKFKNWKEEMQKKEIETSLKKDKEEAKKARDRVREDIERDRQERAARFQKEKNDQIAATQTKADAKASAEAELQAKRDATRRETARMQFRLPDGSSVTQSFPSSDSLSTARDFILQRLNVNAVTLVCTFPKKTFTETDMSASFLDLDLVPSAAVIVLLKSPMKARGDVGDGGGFIKYIVEALLAVWMFFIGLFYKPAQQSGSGSVDSSSAANQRPVESAVHGRVTERDSLQDNLSSRDVRQRQKKSGVKIKKEETGNIHRLRDDNSDSDDENATWNGNSTQQM